MQRTTANQATQKTQSIFIRVTENDKIDELLLDFPEYTLDQLNHYIKLYGPLRSNVIFNLERRRPW